MLTGLPAFAQENSKPAYPSSTPQLHLRQLKVALDETPFGMIALYWAEHHIASNDRHITGIRNAHRDITGRVTRSWNERYIITQYVIRTNEFGLPCGDNGQNALHLDGVLKYLLRWIRPLSWMSYACHAEQMLLRICSGSIRRRWLITL
jgi:hypothetical protein